MKRTILYASLYLVAVVIAPVSWAAEVPFSAQQVISIATDSARSVFAADVDGDGDLDALSASFNDDQIAWHENTLGDGSVWTIHPISTAADGAISVFAADVDGDGDLDVLSASSNDDQVAWYENDGAAVPSFTAHVITEDPDAPGTGSEGDADGAKSVFAADVDGDGDVDVLSVSQFDNKVAWYESDGASPPAFTLHTISTAATSAQSVFAADVDGDGDLDVLSAALTGTEIVWYENDGAVLPTFTPHTVSSAPTTARSVHAADVDGDGDIDVLSASEADDKIAWYENDGGSPPSFTERVVSLNANGAQAVLTGDVDGDGDLDLLSTSQFDSKVAWYENDGATLPSFTERLIASGSTLGPTPVFAADVNGDGNLDVMLALRSDDTIAWYENLTLHRSAVFPQQLVISIAATGAFSVEVADLNRDGNPDVLAASFSNDTVAWYESDGAVPPSFGFHAISAMADEAIQAQPADLDGDGDLDVLAALRAIDTVAWYENTDGAGTFGAAQVISATALGVDSVFAADLDGDGDLDALSASFNSDTVAWYVNDGMGGFGAPQVITSTVNSPVWVRAADLDGDGDADVLSASQNDDTVAWFANDGSGVFGGAQVITSAADLVQTAVTADLDADGDLDVLSASVIDNTVAWYENTDGAGTFGGPQIISTAANGAHAVRVADLDADGDLDVLSTSESDGKIAWYENTDGLGTFGLPQVISTATNFPVSLATADLDRDGDLDVVSASTFDSKLAWYENRGGQFALPTTDTAQKVILDGQVEDLLQIDAMHRGRPGDSDAELVSLEILLEETVGDPLTDIEANNLIQNLIVYLDDGSATFDPGSDILVATVTGLTLTAGVTTIPFVDDDANVQVPFSAPKTYFVVVELTANASMQTPNSFQITHLTESSSSGEDAPHDIPLSLEFSTNVTAGTIDTVLVTSTCTAPFDLNLSNFTVSTDLVCQAGTVLRADTAFVVAAPGGDLTFRAGQSIELGDGFEVQTGAPFRAVIDPALLP